MCIYSELSNDQQVTVRAIFEDLPRSDIPWAKVLDLFRRLTDSINISPGVIWVAIDCQEEQRIGIFICLNEQGCVSRHMIADLRDLLRGVGVEPH